MGGQFEGCSRRASDPVERRQHAARRIRAESPRHVQARAETILPPRPASPTLSLARPGMRCAVEGLMRSTRDRWFSERPRDPHGIPEVPAPVLTARLSAATTGWRSRRRASRYRIGWRPGPEDLAER